MKLLKLVWRSFMGSFPLMQQRSWSPVVYFTFQFQGMKKHDIKRLHVVTEYLLKCLSVTDIKLEGLLYITHFHIVLTCYLGAPLFAAEQFSSKLSLYHLYITMFTSHPNNWDCTDISKKPHYVNIFS